MSETVNLIISEMVPHLKKKFPDLVGSGEAYAGQTVFTQN